jgi:hypothetical protein
MTTLATALLMFFAVVNRIWMFDIPGDVDTWFYLGHFFHFGEYTSTSVPIRNYYQTRLPYILPGWLAFAALSRPVALVVFSTLCFAVIVAGFAYTLSRLVSRSAVALTVVLLASDLYFLRSIGWHYVDNGVLAYQALTWAFLSAPLRRPVGYVHLTLAGASFACMTMVHLGSAVLAPVFAGYLLTRMTMESEPLERYWRYACAGLVGALAALVIFGVLNVAINGSGFFFILDQFHVGRYELVAMPQRRSFEFLLENGFWLVVHGAALFAAVVALAFHWLGRRRLAPLPFFFCLSLILLYTVLILLEGDFTLYLTRSGLYTSFFFILTYAVIGSLVFGGADKVEWKIRAAIVLVAVAVTAARLLGDGKIEFLPTVSPWILMIVMGAGLVIAALGSQLIIRSSGLLGFVCSGALITSPFYKDPGILVAHDAIAAASKGQVPRILFDEKDPETFPVFASITALFTEKAWFLRYGGYPNDSPWLMRPFLTGDKLFILRRGPAEIAAEAERLSRWVDVATPILFKTLDSAVGPTTLVGFEISQSVGLLPQYFNYRAKPIPGAALPGIIGTVDGSGRVALEGRDAPGLLSFGPSASVVPGGAELVFDMLATEPGNTWAITAGDGKATRSVASGEITASISPQQIRVPIQLPVTTHGIQGLVRFGGKGRLEMRGLEILHK